jgi:hypothetical protein
MRNQIDIDEVLSRAIIREIGERLRTFLREDELPASLKVQLDRLDQLDGQWSPSVIPELEIETIGKEHAVADTKDAQTERSVATWASTLAAWTSNAWSRSVRIGRTRTAARSTGSRSRTGSARRWTG